MSRIPHCLDSRLTDGGEVSLTRRPAVLYAQEDSRYSFVYWVSRPQGHCAAGRIKSTEKSNDLMRNGTRDLLLLRQNNFSFIILCTYL
jgi:hypothetical protein